MHFLEWLHRLFVPSHRNAYRPHLLRRRALVVFIGIILAAEGAMVLNMVARQGGYDFLAAVIQSEIITLTNIERAGENVGLLAENYLLNASAQAKANDMAAKGYFAHQSPDGTVPWEWIKEAGYAYQYAGENLAVRFVDSKDVVVAWMASPTHRANIVKPVYAEIGVGIAEGMYKGQPATFVVQHFAKPARAAARTQAAAPPSAPAGTQVLGAEEVPGPGAIPIEEAPAPREVGPLPPEPVTSADDSLARQFARALAEPRATTGWVLGGVAAVLLLALAFAFVHHLQVQAHDLLLPGAVVAGMALLLIGVNARFLVELPGVPQPAGVVQFDRGVLLTPEAASTEEQDGILRP